MPSDTVEELVAAALIAPNGAGLDALARDHLVDHPDNVLVAQIAAASRHKEERA